MSTPTPQCWYAMYIAIFVSCHTPHPPSHKSHLILCPTQVQVSSLRIQFATCVTDMQDYIALQGTLPLSLLQTIVFNFYFLFKKPVDITTQVLNCILNRERLLASCVFMSKHSGHHFYKALNQQVVIPTVREIVRGSQKLARPQRKWREKFSSTLAVFRLWPMWQKMINRMNSPYFYNFNSMMCVFLTY